MTKVHDTARTPADGDSIAVVPEAKALSRFMHSDVNGVIGQRDAASRQALFRLLDFFEIDAFTTTGAGISMRDPRADVEAALDCFLPEEARELPIFVAARRQLADDMVAMARLTALLSGETSCGSRLVVHRGLPQLGGLHQDGSGVVALTTLRGAGTELFANKDVLDWGPFRRRQFSPPMDALREDSAVVAGRGDLVLMKGQRHPHSRPQPEGASTACIHRSPERPARLVAVTYSLK